MKKFDLERAKAGDPIMSRDGNEVEFIAHVPKARLSNQVICLHGVQVLSHHESGHHRSPDYVHECDLFMAPKKRTVWVNLYPSGRAYCFDSEKDASLITNDTIRIGGKAYPVEVDE